ncbi:chromosome segregation ATPase [Pectobacterium carotovorum subsp. carotovorum]|nr:chromosome segregation ATPase [Pectobacterium carotovorum subsp. carotovorum]
MNIVFIAVTAITIVVIGAVIIFSLQTKLRQAKASDATKAAQLERYSVIVDAEAEASRVVIEATQQAQNIVDKAKNTAALLEEEATSLLDDAQSKAISLQEEIATLRASYAEKKNIYDELEKAISIYREDEEFAEMGMFEPHFDFDTSEEFKEAVKGNRSQQKELLRIKNRSGAIWCGTDWTVHNSRTEGKKMTTRAINLTARAFNGECDAAIANCTFKNWSVMHDRIHAAFDKINALNEVNDVHISKEYLRLKLKELDLVHAYKMKKQSEKEEQREIRAQMAEERKVQQEIERSIREAEAEELRAQKALDKARKEMESKFAQLTAEQAEMYQIKIDSLQEALTEAELKGQKALSMAQQTKRGHVYVISNVGSFGENVFKIGMTRRLDPQDRVDELGSASVPFLFDVHAMIHSEDAPALENALHQHFDTKRTNLVNRRKEFFNVGLKEIKNAVYELAGNDVDFIETIVAQHYYETLALRKKNSEVAEIQTLHRSSQLRFAESI